MRRQDVPRVVHGARCAGHAPHRATPPDPARLAAAQYARPRETVTIPKETL